MEELFEYGILRGNICAAFSRSHNGIPKQCLQSLRDSLAKKCEDILVFHGAIPSVSRRFLTLSALCGTLFGGRIEGVRRPGREIVDYPGRRWGTGLV